MRFEFVREQRSHCSRLCGPLTVTHLEACLPVQQVSQGHGRPSRPALLAAAQHHPLVHLLAGQAVQECPGIVLPVLHGLHQRLYLVYCLRHSALWFNRGTGPKPDIQCFGGLYLRFY